MLHLVASYLAGSAANGEPPGQKPFFSFILMLIH
jgi:hypothetical protein